MSEERRRYFRIDDTMGISYRKLGAEEAKVFAAQTRHRGSNFDFAANFDNRIQTLLDSCRVQSPLAAELIDLMNKKLNFIVRQMDLDSDLMHKIAYTLRQVNVSGCGLAFGNQEFLQNGTKLQVDIILQPSELHVMALAEVVACTPVEEGDEVEDDIQYFIRLNFLEINANDQELLIQHIVKRQSNTLKERRQQRNS